MITNSMIEKVIVFCILISVKGILFAQNVGINSSGSTPDNSAGLDIDFTDKGLLPPRMTTSQRDAINGGNPATSLIIYNSTVGCLQIYLGGSWQNILCDCTLPGTLVASAGSGALATQITANWTASAGATTYFLDVDDNIDFSSPLAGYNNLNVGNVTTHNVTGLTCGTTYYYRLRANNSCGTGTNSNTITYTTSGCTISCGVNQDGTGFTNCGDNITYGGQAYGTVLIGGNTAPYCLAGADKQCWMSENLNIGTQVAPGGNQTNDGTIEKYCHGGVNGTTTEGDCSTWGGLYQWDEMMCYGTSVTGNGPGAQGICPNGWHIPTDNEYKCLEMNLGMSQAQADLILAWRGTNQGTQLQQGGSSGFEALWAGVVQAGVFINANSNTHLWTSTDAGANAFNRQMNSGFTGVWRTSAHTKDYGFSVRCVRD